MLYLFYFVVNYIADNMKNLCFTLSFVFLISAISAESEVLKSKIYKNDNFATDIVKNNHFVMFYAPWCTYCKRLHPTWEELAEMLNEDDRSQVTIAKVDCTVSPELCSEHDVTGYPTLLFFTKGKTVGVKFRGTRDLPSLTTFINVQLGSDKEVSDEEYSEKAVPEAAAAPVELTEETFTKHVETGHHFIKFYAPWCGHCQKLAPTWDLLAKEYETDSPVSISKVDCTQYRPICQNFEVKSYPTLLWIHNGKKIDAYKGSRGIDDLKQFVQSKLSSEWGTDAGSAPEIKPIEKKPEPILPPPSPVVELTGKTFQSGIDRGFTFVKFFAPWCGHCKQLAPTWEALAKKAFPRQSVKIAKVDCTLEINKQLCNEQEVDGFPTIFLYRDGKKISEYNGTRALEDLFEFVIRHFHDEL